jgi:hypothetical protein
MLHCDLKWDGGWHSGAIVTNAAIYGTNSGVNYSAIVQQFVYIFLVQHTQIPGLLLLILRLVLVVHHLLEHKLPRVIIAWPSHARSTFTPLTLIGGEDVLVHLGPVVGLQVILSPAQLLLAVTLTCPPC